MRGDDRVSRPWGESHKLGLDRPNAARMYDYYLGGAQNFALDREYADRALARFPHAARTARANRAFLARAVRYCLRSGIRQFLDLGSGIPTVGNVHEIAHPLAPESQVAYVDNEPVAVAHGRQLLAGVAGATVTHADLRHPERVLNADGVAGLLDLDRPVAVLLVAVLHFVADEDDPTGIVARYRDAVPGGSALVISHVSDDQPTEQLAVAQRRVAEVYRHTSTPAHLRDRRSIAGLFAGAKLVEPGLVDTLHWRPERPQDPDDHCGFYAGVARTG